MPLAEHFSAGGGMRFCIHTEKFMRVLGTNHDSNEWKFFSDSQKGA